MTNPRPSLLLRVILSWINEGWHRAVDDLGTAGKNLSLHRKQSIRKREKEENAVGPLVNLITFRGLKS